MTTTTRKYASIASVKWRNEDAGQHFFSPSTLRFFSSRVLPTLYGAEGSIFVTSEKDPFGNPRAYTVRQIREDGSIDTLGEFQGYATSAQAAKAARDFARAQEVDGA